LKNLILENLNKQQFLTEAKVELSNVNEYKIHVPLIVTTNIDKQSVKVLANVQQVKIANNIENMLERMPKSFFSSMNSLIKNSLVGESAEAEIADLTDDELKQDLEIEIVTEGIISGTASVIGGTVKGAGRLGYGAVAADYEGEDIVSKRRGITGKDKVNNDGAMYESPYTIFNIKSKNRFGRFFGFEKTIMVRVYAIYLDEASFTKGISQLAKDVATKTNVVERKAKDGKSLFKQAADQRPSLASLITKEMIDNRAWLSVVGNRAVGASIAVDSFTAENMKYAGSDLYDPSVMKKIVSAINAFDFFIFKPEAEAIEVLDSLTYNFDEIPIGYFKSQTKTRKVSLSIDG
jgi:hypothetical protein